MSTRKPTVAGSFYPATQQELLGLFEKMLRSESPKIKPFPNSCEIVGVILPHAGYIYSGYEALHFFVPLAKCATKFETVIILHPDHRGLGNEMAYDANDSWETPLGTVPVDVEFAKHLEIECSSKPHNYEHSGEVMVPFLQHFIKHPFKILPIAITYQIPEIAKSLAHKINNAVKISNRNILIIASSDFSHYLSPEKGAKLDDIVLEEILKFDANSVYHAIRNQHISVCGYGPIMTLIEYSKLLNHEVKADILVRGNSGKAHPSDDVVDYNTVLFYI